MWPPGVPANQLSSTCRLCTCYLAQVRGSFSPRTPGPSHAAGLLAARIRQGAPMPGDLLPRHAVALEDLSLLFNLCARAGKALPVLRGVSA